MKNNLTNIKILANLLTGPKSCEDIYKNIKGIKGLSRKINKLIKVGYVKEFEGFLFLTDFGEELFQKWVEEILEILNIAKKEEIEVSTTIYSIGDSTTTIYSINDHFYTTTSNQLYIDDKEEK